MSFIFNNIPELWTLLSPFFSQLCPSAVFLCTSRQTALDTLLQICFPQVGVLTPWGRVKDTVIWQLTFCPMYVSSVLSYFPFYQLSVHALSMWHPPVSRG